MKVEQVQISERPLIDAYRHNFSQVQDFFVYDPNQKESFTKRYAHLLRKTFPRAAAVEALSRYNRQLGVSEETLTNIQRLSDERTVAVITGQQAGVLTGPLYTIYKALTVVQLADRLTTDGIPTVPVFWIASEDHDFYEIAGVNFLNRENQEVEVRLAGESERRPIGRLSLQTEVAAFLDEFAGRTPDTDFKPAMMERLRRMAETSTDLAQWFGQIMAWLFTDTGLIFVDALDPALRTLGKDFFLDVFQQHSRITERLHAADARLTAAGFPTQVQVSDGQAHLFLLRNDIRYSLEAGSADTFLLRGLEETYTAREISDWITGHPETVSTNVVTRPLFQDQIFPTLAYVGGPGEIAYYAQYREVYALFDLEMPIIFPRVSITLVERSIAKGLQKYNLSVMDILSQFETVRDRFLAEADALNLPERFGRFKGAIIPAYQRLIHDLQKLDPKFKELGKQNLQRILDEVGYLEEKANQQHRKNSEDLLNSLEKFRSHLAPGGMLQERRFTVFPYLFKYQTALLRELLALDLTMADGHYLIHL